MVTTLARAGAIALALLALPASAHAAGSPPAINVTSQGTLSVLAGWEVGFEARAADPDGDVVTLTWAFDDGFMATGEQARHAWTEPGLHIAIVTATDPTGLTDLHTFMVDVQPNPNNLMPLPTSPPPGFVLPDVNARPRAVLAAGSLTLSKTRSVAVRLACQIRPCKGTVALALAGKRFATASFSVDAVQTTRAYVVVSPLTAKRLRRHRSVAVAVTVAVRGADPASTTRTRSLRTR